MRSYLLDDANDLVIAGGTFATGETDLQDAQLVAMLGKGENKSAPGRGYGLMLKMKSKLEGVQLKADLENELKADGFAEATVTVSPFKIEATREEVDNG